MVADGLGHGFQFLGRAHELEADAVIDVEILRLEDQDAVPEAAGDDALGLLEVVRHFLR